MIPQTSIIISINDTLGCVCAGARISLRSRMAISINEVYEPKRIQDTRYKKEGQRTKCTTVFNGYQLTYITFNWFNSDNWIFKIMVISLIKLNFRSK